MRYGILSNQNFQHAILNFPLIFLYVIVRLKLDDLEKYFEKLRYGILSYQDFPTCHTKFSIDFFICYCRILEWCSEKIFWKIEIWHPFKSRFYNMPYLIFHCFFYMLLTNKSFILWKEILKNLDTASFHNKNCPTCHTKFSIDF